MPSASEGLIFVESKDDPAQKDAGSKENQRRPGDLHAQGVLQVLILENYGHKLSISYVGYANVEGLYWHHIEETFDHLAYIHTGWEDQHELDSCGKNCYYKHIDEPSDDRCR